MDNPTIQSVPSIPFGNDLIEELKAKFIELNDKCPKVGDLSQKQRKKIVKTFEQTILNKDLPLWLASLLLQQQDLKYKSISSGRHTVFKKDEDAFKMIIRVVEKREGSYRFSLEKTTQYSLDDFQDEYQERNKDELLRGFIIFYLMNLVSYKYWRDNNKETEIKRENHLYRDWTLCKHMLHVCKDSNDDNLEILRKFLITCLGDENLIVWIKSGFLDQASQPPGACQYCWEDSIVRRKHLEHNVVHEPFGANCDYVCNCCLKPGHHYANCVQNTLKY